MQTSAYQKKKYQDICGKVWLLFVLCSQKKLNYSIHLAGYIIFKSATFFFNSVLKENGAALKIYPENFFQSRNPLNNINVYYIFYFMFCGRLPLLNVTKCKIALTVLWLGLWLKNNWFFLSNLQLLKRNEDFSSFASFLSISILLWIMKIFILLVVCLILHSCNMFINKHFFHYFINKHDC